MMHLILVFIGGGTGSVLRYLTGKWFVQQSFPYGTLVANCFACIIAGMVLGIMQSRTGISTSIRLALLTGFCGGLSTFSAFTVETIQLMMQGKSLSALLNIGLNIGFGFLAFFALYKLTIQR